MKNKRAISAILLAALLLCLAACGENILPPKEGLENTPAPMPTPAPTPMPTPFSGAIVAVEFSQNPGAAAGDDAGAAHGAHIPVTSLAAGRDTVVHVRLSDALGHAPDARDYLELFRGEEKLGVWTPEAQGADDCLCYTLANDGEFSLTAGEYTVRAVVDDMTTVQNFSVQETRDVRVLLLPLRGNFDGEAVYVAEDGQSVFDLLQQSLPVSNDGIAVVRAPGMDLSAEEYDLRTGRGMWMAWEAIAARAGTIGSYDLVVGLVSGAMGAQADCDSFGLNGVCLLDVTGEDPDAALARCAAEVFGLSAEIGSTESWEKLLGALAEEEAPADIPTEKTGLLRVTGLLGEDGYFALRSALPAQEGTASVTELTEEGSFILRFTDASGALLQEAFIAPDFSAAGYSDEMKGFAPLDLTVSVPEGAAKLELFAATEQPAEGEDAAEAIWTLDLTMAEVVTSFTELPEGEALLGIARVEWESEVVASPVQPEETEDEDGEEPEKLPTPDPEYELYMCYDGLRLLVYRGRMNYAELDMPSLPKPEEFSFLLLTNGGTWAKAAASPVCSLAQE